MKTRLLLSAALAAAWLATLAGQQQDDKFRFRTSVELINVAATVTDRNGRFVPGLRREDFRIYEDGVEQQLTHFDRERVPVSLGLVLDTSGSMEGEKMRAANAALDRFLYDLLGDQDEVFLYRFDARPQLLEGWTVDRRRVSAELRRIQPRGGTALYDAVAEALPLAAEGSRKKKAMLVISDGNDTSSVTEVDRSNRWSARVRCCSMPSESTERALHGSAAAETLEESAHHDSLSRCRSRFQAGGIRLRPLRLARSEEARRAAAMVR